MSNKKSTIDYNIKDWSSRHVRLRAELLLSSFSLFALSTGLAVPNKSSIWPITFQISHINETIIIIFVITLYFSYALYSRTIIEWPELSEYFAAYDNNKFELENHLKDFNAITEKYETERIVKSIERIKSSVPNASDTFGDVDNFPIEHYEHYYKEIISSIRALNDEAVAIKNMMENRDIHDRSNLMSNLSAIETVKNDISKYSMADAVKSAIDGSIRAHNSTIQSALKDMEEFKEFIIKHSKEMSDKLRENTDSIVLSLRYNMRSLQFVRTNLYADRMYVSVVAPAIAAAFMVTFSLCGVAAAFCAIFERYI